MDDSFQHQGSSPQQTSKKQKSQLDVSLSQLLYPEFKVRFQIQSSNAISVNHHIQHHAFRSTRDWLHSERRVRWHCHTCARQRARRHSQREFVLERVLASLDPSPTTENGSHCRVLALTLTANPHPLLPSPSAASRSAAVAPAPTAPTCFPVGARGREARTQALIRALGQVGLAGPLSSLGRLLAVASSSTGDGKTATSE